MSSPSLPDPGRGAPDPPLGPEQRRLVPRAAKELAATHAGGEPQVVPDHRARARLAECGLDHHDPIALRSGVQRRREPGRAQAHDGDIERLGGGLAVEAEPLDDRGNRGARDRRLTRQLDDGDLTVEAVIREEGSACLRFGVHEREWYPPPLQNVAEQLGLRIVVPADDRDRRRRRGSARAPSRRGCPRSRRGTPRRGRSQGSRSYASISPSIDARAISGIAVRSTKLARTSRRAVGKRSRVRARNAVPGSSAIRWLAAISATSAPVSWSAARRVYAAAGPEASRTA